MRRGLAHVPTVRRGSSDRIGRAETWVRANRNTKRKQLNLGRPRVALDPRSQLCKRPRKVPRRPISISQSTSTLDPNSIRFCSSLIVSLFQNVRFKSIFFVSEPRVSLCFPIKSKSTSLPVLFWNHFETKTWRAINISSFGFSLSIVFFFVQQFQTRFVVVSGAPSSTTTTATTATTTATANEKKQLIDTDQCWLSLGAASPAAILFRGRFRLFFLYLFTAAIYRVEQVPSSSTSFHLSFSFSFRFSFVFLFLT